MFQRRCPLAWIEDRTLVLVTTLRGMTEGRFGLSVNVYTPGPSLRMLAHAYFVLILANAAPTPDASKAGGIACEGRPPGGSGGTWQRMSVAKSITATGARE